MTQKPKIEDVIGDLLDGENLSNALDFINFLKKNKLNINWARTNVWKVVKNGVTLLYIHAGVTRDTAMLVIPKFIDNNDLEKGSWVTGPPSLWTESSHRITTEDKSYNMKDGYEEIIANDKITNMLRSKVRPCMDCGNKKKCGPGINIYFLGEKITNRCKFAGVSFVNPDPDELECIKNLTTIFCEVELNIKSN